MISKKNKILIEILILIILIFFSVFKIYFLRKNPIGLSYGVNSPHPASIKIESPSLLIKERGHEGEANNQATLEINGTKYEALMSAPTKIDELMQKLQDEGKISFKEKTYIGMGKFIEEINGIKNGEKNWIYYVNGIKANIGVSNYQIKNGDIVSWKYEENY